MEFYDESFSIEKEVKEPLYQMAKLITEEMSIINVYRSQGANTERFIHDLLEMINLNEHTLVVGDFNICFQKNPTHSIFQTLRNLNFEQLVKNSTHIDGGLIDLVFGFSPDQLVAYEVDQQAQYFTDHDLLCIRYVIKIYFRPIQMNKFTRPKAG